MNTRFISSFRKQPNPLLKQKDYLTPKKILLFCWLSLLSIPLLSAQNGTINTNVWDDRNANSTKQGGEPGIENVTVELYTNTDVKVAEETTDASGNATFINVTPGSYYLKYTLPTDHKFTPMASTLTDNANSDARTGITNLGKTNVFSVAADETISYVDAGMWTPGSVTTNVFDDRNANSTKQGGEPGIGGVTVELYDGTNDNLLASGTTDGSGNVTLSPVPADRPVYLKYTLLADHKFTSRASTLTDNGNSDARTGSGVEGETFEFSVASGNDHIQYVDAGMWTPGSVTTNVFDDRNANSTKQGGEPGIGGVTVELYDGTNDNLLASGTTDGSGNVTLSPVPADRPVYLKYTLLTDHKFTPRASTLTDNGNSDARTGSGVEGETFEFSVASGNDHIQYVDAGMWTPGSVTTNVFDDRNANSTKQGGEPGIAGVTVKLYDSADDNVLASGTTDANGNITFAGVVPADRPVYLKYTLPADHKFTPRANTLTDNGNSDARTGNSVLGETFEFSVSKGNETITYVDAGMWTPGLVVANVWDDKNGNGTKQGGEDFLFGFLVEMYETNGDPLNYPAGHPNAGQHVTALTQCGNGGASLYIPADRSVYLKFVANGATFTTKGSSLTANNNSDAKTGSGAYGETSSFAVGEGNDVISYVDAGVTDRGTLWSDATINTFVWDDQNADGTHQGEGSKGIEGVKVRLTDDAGNTCVCETTDSDGKATLPAISSFTNRYRLQYDLKADHEFTSSSGNITDDKNSDAKLNATGGRKTAKFSIAAGETINYIEAGMFAPGTLHTFVWDDINNNGDHQGEGSNGIEGVIVELVETDGTTPVKYPKWHPNKNQVVTAAPTGSDGKTSFDYIPADRQLRLLYTIKDDHKFSFGSGAVTNDKNSDIYTASSGVAETRKFSMIKGSETISYVECGMLAPGQLNTFVFDDRNNNGDHQGEGSFGIEGVQVQLVEQDGSTPVVYPDWWTGPGNAGDPVATVITDSDGKASIHFIPADRHVRLLYTIKDDHKFVFGSGAVTVANNSDIYTASAGVAETRKFSLAGGSETISYVECGMLVPGTLNTFVFDDRNADGTHQGEGGFGIEGIQVQLVEQDGSTPVNYPDWWTGPGNAGDPVATVTTGSGGKASIDFIPADRFVRLVYTLKEDYRFTTSSGSVDIDNNSDVYTGATTIAGETRKFMINQGSEEINYVEAGMWAPGTINTFVWEDVDGDGTHQGEGGNGVAGVTVTLFEQDGSTVVTDNNSNPVTAVTNASGQATLSYVPAGRQLRVGYAPNPGAVFSTYSTTLENDKNNDVKFPTPNGTTVKFAVDRGSMVINYIEAGLTDVGIACPIANSGFKSVTKKGEARWRNFRTNNSGWDVAVGTAAGTPGQFSQNDFGNSWRFGTANQVTMTYDPVTETLSTSTTNIGGTYTASYNVGDLGTVNYMQWQVNGDPGKTLEFNNVELTVNGVTCNLGDFQTEYGDWYIDYDLSSGFEISGDLVFYDQATNQEGMKLNITIGEETVVPLKSNSNTTEELESAAISPYRQYTDAKELVIIDVKLFPNPARHYINVSFELKNDVEEGMYRIIDVTGRTLKSGQEAMFKGKNLFHIDLHGLQGGHYTLQIRTNKEWVSKPFILISG